MSGCRSAALDSISDPHSHHHRHKVGIPASIAYIVGCIVGSGIFFTPAIITRHVGSVGLSMVIWLLGAGVALLGSLVYIELGTCIPKSGSNYAYMRHAGWNTASAVFFLLYTSVTNPCGTAISALTLGEYVTVGMEQWQGCPIVPSWRPTLKRLIGFTTLMPLLYANLFEVRRFAATIQMAATAIKVCVLAVIASIGIYLLFAGLAHGSLLSHPFHDSSMKLGSIYTALITAMFAYGGYNSMNCATEEVRNPSRTLPISALCSVALVAGLYLLINIAFFSVLTVDEMAKSEAVAFSFAHKAMSPAAQYIMPFLVSLLLVANLNATPFLASRLIAAGARAGTLPTAFECVHLKSMCPRAAVFYDATFAVAYSFLGDLDELIGYSAPIYWMDVSVTMLALIYMRWRKFSFPNSAYVNHPAVVVAFLLITFSLAVVPVIEAPVRAVASSVALAASFTLYYAFIKPTGKGAGQNPNICQRVNDWSIRATQIVFNVMPIAAEDPETEILPCNSDLLMSSKSKDNGSQ